ncbi:MAG: hypothetical protein ABSB74_11720 [Tepidisphaeraceae bacterium]
MGSDNPKVHPESLDRNDEPNAKPTALPWGFFSYPKPKASKYGRSAHVV